MSPKWFTSIFPQIFSIAMLAYIPWLSYKSIQIPIRLASTSNDLPVPALAGWWFGPLFIFPYIWNNHPNWLIFFRGVETTNQKIYPYIYIYPYVTPHFLMLPPAEALPSPGNRCQGAAVLADGQGSHQGDLSLHHLAWKPAGGGPWGGHVFSTTIGDCVQPDIADIMGYMIIYVIGIYCWDIGSVLYVAMSENGVSAPESW